MEQARVLRCRLNEFQLAYYPPSLRQEAHGHDVPHVSLVIAGSFVETTEAGSRTVWQGRAGFRADGACHEVDYGPAGALILSFATDSWRSAGRPRDGVGWVPAPAGLARRLIEAQGSGIGLSGIWTGVGADASRPAWVVAAAERLLRAPRTPIATLAHRYGVHRVHFSRQFARYCGMAPSQFRRRAMAIRALGSTLSGGASLAGAAAEAGFADQSHMARAMRGSWGLGAGELRRLLTREATSVQSGGGIAR